MFLTGLALKSTVVLACAWMITMMLRRRSAAVRHLVWTAASAAVLILPLLWCSLPAWRVPVAATFPGPATFQVSGSARALARRLAAKSGMPAPVSKGSEVPPIDWNLVAESVGGGHLAGTGANAVGMVRSGAGSPQGETIRCS